MVGCLWHHRRGRRPVAGQIIGLCYRDGSKDIVLEEVLRTEGVPYARLHDLSRLAESGLRGLILGEGFDGSAAEIKRFVGKGGVLLCLNRPDAWPRHWGWSRSGLRRTAT